MLSNATYTAWDRTNAAADWSRAIATDLLRTELGFRGVTITDSLNGTAAARGVSPRALASKSISAGVDMVMFTGRESGTSAAFGYLLDRAEAGAYDLTELRASYDRIVALRLAYAP